MAHKPLRHARGRRYRRQLRTALRTIRPAMLHSTATIRAGWLHSCSAVRAENESGFHRCRAPWTRPRQRVAQNKVEDYPDAVGYQGRKPCPQYIAHAATLRVRVDVADEQDPCNYDQKSAVGECALSSKRPDLHFVVLGNEDRHHYRRHREITDDRDEPRRPRNYL